MDRHCKFLFAMALSLFLGTSPARSGEKPALAVSIAVPKSQSSEKGKAGARLIRITDRSHFHVVVTNTSNTPQRLWESWCSWGYDNLQFEVADDKGKVLYVIEKKPAFFTVNYPSWVEIAPGEHFVLDVDFDASIWTLPFIKAKRQGEFSLRMRAIFTSGPDKESKAAKVWTGTVKSAYRNYQLGYWR